MSGLDWLIARPVAHRGLHDARSGVIENTPSAFAAAVAGNYAIECDLQITADGEAMVHHDDTLGRLTEGSGRLDAMTAAALKRVAFPRHRRPHDHGRRFVRSRGRPGDAGDRAEKPLRRRPAAGRPRRRGAVALFRPGRADVVRSGPDRGAAGDRAGTAARHRRRAASTQRREEFGGRHQARHGLRAERAAHAARNSSPMG